MPAKTQSTKNGKKAQAKAPPAPVSRTPLLDAAKLDNPHKQAGFGGWNKPAALLLAAEFASLVTETMTIKERLALEVEYKTFAGWDNCNDAVLAKFGLKRIKTVPAPVAAA